MVFFQIAKKMQPNELKLSRTLCNKAAHPGYSWYIIHLNKLEINLYLISCSGHGSSAADNKHAIGKKRAY